MRKMLFTGLFLLLAGGAAKGAEADRLVHEVVVDAPRAQVWAAFTTKKGLESWMVAHAEIDLKVGGKMRTHYDARGKLGDPRTIENLILSFDPGRMLSLKIGKAPEGFPFPNAARDTWSVLYFEDAGSGRTRVTVIGLGYRDDEESEKMKAFFHVGNAYTLKQLQKRFAKASK